MATRTIAARTRSMTTQERSQSRRPRDETVKDLSPQGRKVGRHRSPTTRTRVSRPAGPLRSPGRSASSNGHFSDEFDDKYSTAQAFKFSEEDQKLWDDAEFEDEQTRDEVHQRLFAKYANSPVTQQQPAEEDDLE